MGISINSYILTDIGYKKLSSLVEKELGIHDFSTPLKIITDGNLVRTIKSYKVNPVSKIYELILEDGHSIRTNFNSKFMTLFRNNLKFRRVEDLKTGHYLFTSLGSNIFNDNPSLPVSNKFFTYYDNDFSYLLGMLISGGKFQDDKLCIYQIQNKTRDRCKRIFSKFCDSSDVKFTRVSSCKADLEIDSPLLMSFLKRMNLLNLEIPLEMLISSKDSIYWFFRGITNGIGMVHVRNKAIIMNDNKGNLEKLQILLNFIGIKNIRKDNCIALIDHESNYFKFMITKGAIGITHISDRYRLVKEICPDSDKLISKKYYPCKIKEIKVIGEKRTISLVTDDEYIVNSFILKD